MERDGEPAGHRARRVARAGREHPPARRAPRVPADLQRAQDPAPTEARAPEAVEARRLLPVRPRGGEMDLARVAGPGVAWAARGSPLNPRGLGWRLCDGGALRPAGRRPYPGPHHPAPGPLTRPSQHPQPPQSQEPVRHRRSAPGPEPPASMRSRVGARQPGRRALPAFNRSGPAAPPLGLSPPPPATSRLL